MYCIERSVESDLSEGVSMDGLGFYRVGNWCHRHRVPGVPWLMKALTRVVHSAHVPCEASIGRTSMLGYRGLGVVIHHRAVIGENVIVGSHVVIGGRSGHEMVPVIGDDVFIGAGACILGPVKVGDGSVIGANAVVIHDVEPHTVVAGVPATTIRTGVDPRDYGDLPDTIRARR